MKNRNAIIAIGCAIILWALCAWVYFGVEDVKWAINSPVSQAAVHQA